MKNYFFKDVPDIQSQLGVSQTFRVQDFQPSLRRTVNRYLRNDYGIGKVFCDSILADYNNGFDSLPSKKKELVEAIRAPLANLAFYHYTPISRMNYDKDGASEDASKNLRMWVSDDAREEFLDAGFEDLELLLEFLEDNKEETAFSAWASGNAYTVYKEGFINTVFDFNRQVPIVQSRRTFLAIRHIQRRVEEGLILSILGQTIYDALKTKIKAGTALDNTEKDYMKSIIPCVAHLTMHDAYRELSVKINSQGLQVFSKSANTENSREAKPASAEELLPLKEAAEQNGKKYSNELFKKINPTADSGRTGDFGNKKENKFFRL